MRMFESGNVRMHYNSDLSGNVEIQRLYADGSVADACSVPGWALLDLVAQVVIDERIAKLEQAETEEILGVKVHR